MITEFDDDTAGIQRRNELKRRWLWGSGAALILLSVISVTSFPLGMAFPFLLIAGLSLLPPVWQLAEEWWAAAENYPIAIRAGLVMLAIAVGGLLLPFSGKSQNDASDSATEQKPTDRVMSSDKEGKGKQGRDNQPAPANIATTTSATVIQAQVVPFRSPSPDIKHLLQMVITTWKNTGTTPIRVIETTFTFRDADKQIVGTYDYTLYAAFNSFPGVPPGSTYTTPKGEGFIFPKSFRPPVLSQVKAASVEVTITRVLEHADF